LHPTTRIPGADANLRLTRWTSTAKCVWWLSRKRVSAARMKRLKAPVTVWTMRDSLDRARVTWSAEA
jgi:hypothetical protein